ncbi:general odorant-binding protein 66-like [Ochlerotatus camptorhynchus]|uniref:general odorant-binding protein 66-like n=1 Tax=Ochlerotatus camptorhynchus TaxID=644619 RepID=UPI0031D6ED33
MNRFAFYALLALMAGLDKAPVQAEECIDAQKNAEEIQKCCDIPSPLEMEKIQACKEKYEQELSQDMPNMIVCILECHATELGVINGDTLNEAELLKMGEQIEDPVIRELAIPIMKECGASSSEMVKQSQGHNFKCPPLAYMLTECIMQGIFANCPDSHWAKNSPVCDQIKAGAKPCQ